MQGIHVEPGLEGKMIGFRRDFRHLQLDVGAQRHEEMATLRGDGFGRRLGQRGVLLERLVIRFHGPSFAIACGEPV